MEEYKFNPLRFFEYSLAGYGALWAILMFAAVVTQSHLNAGQFGFYGFPILALFYGAIRSHVAIVAEKEALEAQNEELRSLRDRQDLDREE